mmetsp:Transcript_37715/g.87597  ORF Transcript_37715/g.87597 Transcript_37715/m.87597 type:complete len:226 (-) Transcript_37715:339-1016(-)
MHCYMLDSMTRLAMSCSSSQGKRPLASLCFSCFSCKSVLTSSREFRRSTTCRASQHSSKCCSGSTLKSTRPSNAAVLPGRGSVPATTAFTKSRILATPMPPALASRCSRWKSKSGAARRRMGPLVEKNSSTSLPVNRWSVVPKLSASVKARTSVASCSIATAWCSASRASCSSSKCTPSELCSESRRSATSPSFSTCCARRSLRAAYCSFCRAISETSLARPSCE